ncbi:SMP-30/gluconolactonase/LRE family protein [Janibacter cremeus]|uniref:SMP-30/gluconolactonase/LRE family protein n=1 Tax=Janibacter cremeus TaxID=1285192 RepID=UPI002483997A|nr:SMP-30/gluconolactonase/LRE family protein [Janibacter cremeus]
MRHDRGVPAPLAFLEGPVLDGAGGLYMVDVAWGRILYVDRYGEFRVVVEYDGEPNGLALAGPDRLLVADYQRGLVEIADLRGEPRVGVVVHEVDGAAFHGLNDLVVTSDGTVYVTDQGDSGLDDPYGRLLRVRLPAGGENATEEGNATQVAVEVVLEGIPSPNGLVWDEKSATVFVAVTRDNAIWRVPLVESVPHRVGRYLQLSGGLGPDGMAAGPQGTLLVAHLGLGVVWVFDPTGTAVMALHSPTGRAVTNLCVTDNGRVFVTESETSTVLTADLSRLLDHDFPRRNLS